jgi:DNA-binding response OmpR family regulator
MVLTAKWSTRAVAYSVLMVDVDRKSLSEASAVFADAGYLVMQASTFADARQRLVLSKPDLLITAIRLAGFNGLHLVVSSRSTLPGTITVVTHAVADPALQADAARHDAIYLVKPVDWTLFLNVVSGALAERGAPRRSARPRRWARTSPADRVDAALGITAATLLDLSYGGVRLELSARAADSSRRPQTLVVTAAGVAVHARAVWTQGAGPDGPWWCGVEVQEPDPAADRAWRAFVDSVRPSLRGP